MFLWCGDLWGRNRSTIWNSTLRQSANSRNGSQCFNAQPFCLALSFSPFLSSNQGCCLLVVMQTRTGMLPQTKPKKKKKQKQQHAGKNKQRQTHSTSRDVSFLRCSLDSPCSIIEGGPNLPERERERSETATVDNTSHTLRGNFQPSALSLFVAWRRQFKKRRRSRWACGAGDVRWRTRLVTLMPQLSWMESDVLGKRTVKEVTRNFTHYVLKRSYPAAGLKRHLFKFDWKKLILYIHSIFQKYRLSRDTPATLITIKKEYPYFIYSTRKNTSGTCGKTFLPQDVECFPY